MIHIKVGLALKITDGYTGAPANGAGFDITVDGLKLPCIKKQGGYVVFSNLSAGKHELVIKSPLYLTERMEFETGCGLMPVVMKPASGYPYGRNASKLRVSCSGNNPLVFWAGQQRQDIEIKIAQSGLSAGDSELKLFFAGQAERLPLPGYFLLIDGESSEICLLDALNKNESSALSEPLRSEHKRGCSLCPALMYRVEPQQSTELIFRDKTPVSIWIPELKKLVDVDAGQEELTI